MHIIEGNKMENIEEEHHNHHHHNHFNKKNSKKLLIVLFITTIYMIAEFLGGYFTKSLALTADAGHMLGDSASLALSFFALWLTSQKARSEEHTSELQSPDH